MTIVPGRRARADRGAAVARASGLVVGLAGAGLVGVGLWGQREVRTALARERIVSTPDAKPPSAPVRSGAAARSMAEAIRRRTVEAAGGRTYSQVDAYLDEEGNGTTDSAAALVDERTKAPLEHPHHALRVQSTTLQTALMQAYVSSRIAMLTAGLGAVLVAAGAGLAAAGSARR